MCWQRVKISDGAAEFLIPRILMTHQCYIARTLMTPGQLLKTTTKTRRKCENTKQHLAELKGGASNTSRGQQSTWVKGTCGGIIGPTPFALASTLLHSTISTCLFHLYFYFCVRFLGPAFTYLYFDSFTWLFFNVCMYASCKCYFSDVLSYIVPS